LVRPFAVVKCDLDNAFLFNNVSLKLKLGSLLAKVDASYKKLFGNLLTGPFPFGHECVAEVIEIGEGVNHIKVGDVVSVPFQISCGSCITCKSGFTSSCSNVPSVSTFGFGKHLQFGGAMSDVLKVPFADEMLIKIPEHINPIHLASLSDNVPDAFRHVESLQKNPNQSMLIVGGKAQSVGLYTALLAKSLGANQVDYVDNNTERLAIAKNIGVDNVIESFSGIKEEYDIVVDASSTEKGLLTAIKSIRPYGTVSSSDIYMQKTVMPLLDMYANGATFKTGFANARTDAEKVLQLIENNKLDLSLVTSKVATWDNAIEGFLTDSAKVIVTRDRLTT
jgi:threonine dehydrogenase-like Zn-dependent dehydrogenase